MSDSAAAAVIPAATADHAFSEERPVTPPTPRTPRTPRAVETIAAPEVVGYDDDAADDDDDNTEAAPQESLPPKIVKSSASKKTGTKRAKSAGSAAPKAKKEPAKRRRKLTTAERRRATALQTAKQLRVLVNRTNARINKLTNSLKQAREAHRLITELSASCVAKATTLADLETDDDGVPEAAVAAAVFLADGDEDAEPENREAESGDDNDDAAVESGADDDEVAVGGADEEDDE